MEYIAESRNVKISPRKVKLVADAIKTQSIPVALTKLLMLNKRAALPVKKTVESAIANAVNNFKADRSGLVIKELIVNEGIRYKRYHYAARGRIRPYKRRTSHIRVVLADKAMKKTKSIAQSQQGKEKEDILEKK